MSTSPALHLPSCKQSHVQLANRCWLCRQLGWNARLLALVSTAVLVVDSDFLAAESSSWFLFEVIAGRSGPYHLLLQLFPWGLYGWYGGCFFLGMSASSTGAMSIFAGRSASFRSWPAQFHCCSGGCCKLLTVQSMQQNRRNTDTSHI